MAFICDFHSDANETAEQEKQAKRPSFVCLAMGAAVLAGLLLPLPTEFVDVLIILSLSLTAASVIISVSAKTVSEISGFEHLIKAITVLRSFILVICCRLILTQGDTGIIVSFFYKVASVKNTAFMILALPLSAGTAFIALFTAVKKVRQIAKSFVCDTVRFKYCHIEEELRIGLIDQQQAKELRNIIQDEENSFERLQKASDYVLYDGMIEFIFIILCFAGGLIIGVFETTISTVSRNTYLHLTLGTVITIQFPAFVTALAYKLLVHKYSEKADKKAQSQEHKKQRIKVNCCEVKEAEKIKNSVQERPAMLNIDKLKTDGNKNGPNQSERYKLCRRIPGNVHITEELQWADEQKCSHDYNSHLWNVQAIKERYEEVSELIISRCRSNTRTLLMGAEGTKTVPVTIPINVAIQLAKKDHRCLLIDLDYQRDSVARVFELHTHILDEHISSGHTITGIPTCVRNLWIYPSCWLTENSHNVTTLDCTKINQIITHLKIKYDYIIIYSPNLKEHHSCELIGECIDGAMLFGKHSLNLRKAFELMERFECEILKPEQMPAHATRISR